MKYIPDYEFVDKLFVEQIVIDQTSESITLLARFLEQDGISSIKHLFCDTSELAKLLCENTQDAEKVLDNIVYLIGNDLLGDPEEIDLELLLGHPLTLSKYRIRVYHPLVENATEGPMIFDNGLYELDRIIPKL